MLFKRFFEFDRTTTRGGGSDSSINEGIYYLYLIIGLQVAFILALLGVIMFIGRVLATPAWVFVFVMLLGFGGLIYVYRKAKAQFRRFRESLQKVHVSNRNYEISFMGGMLTMRVEHNNRPLLEAPGHAVADRTDNVLDAEANVLDAETVETPTPH